MELLPPGAGGCGGGKSCGHTSTSLECTPLCVIPLYVGCRIVDTSLPYSSSTSLIPSQV